MKPTADDKPIRMTGWGKRARPEGRRPIEAVHKREGTCYQSLDRAHWRRGLLRRVLRNLYATLLLATLAGCHQGMYDASALPPGLAAVPVVDVTTLDLSRLATDVRHSSAIQPGDVLDVMVATGLEQRPQRWELAVSDEGTIDVPLVGTVPVAYREVHDAQLLVRQASIDRGLYRQPSVSVAVSERRTHRVTVTGAVEEPGTYELPLSDSHLLAALVAAGGLTPEADTIIEIRQPAPAAQAPTSAPTNGVTVAAAGYQNDYNMSQGTLSQGLGAQTVDLVAATSQNAAVPGQYALSDGAVVVVQQQSKRYVHVVGLVRRPNRFELPAGQNVTVLDAIAMAQGLTISAADRVLVLRKTDLNPQPVTIEVSLSEAKENPSTNLLLADGDIVSVEETPATIALGAVKQFVRIGLRTTDFY